MAFLIGCDGAWGNKKATNEVAFFIDYLIYYG